MKETRPRTSNNNSQRVGNAPRSASNIQRGGNPNLKNSNVKKNNLNKNLNKNRNKKNNNGKNVTIILASVLFCIVSGGGTYLYSQMNGVSEIIEKGGIYPNIFVDGIDMEGLSVDEAVALLKNQHNKTIEGQALNYTYKGDAYPITFDEVDWKYFLEDAVQEAYDIGRTGSKKEITKIIRELEEAPMEISILIDYNEEKLENFLLSIEQNFATDPVNSKMEKSGLDFVITPDVTGVKMDLQATLHNTLESLENNMGTDIPIVVIEEPAKYTASDFNFEKDLIGSFTTSYSTSQTNRQNLETGSAYLDGTIIMPGETFSAAEGMGEQTAERGYVSAGVFVGGKLVNGMGGGICQVSTTVYNAALMAELEIVERWPHSMPVGYVPLGRDAAIADGYKDLVIKNDTDSPIYLEAYARDGVLAANFYGKEIHEEGRTVSFDTVLVSTTAKPAEVVTKDANMYVDQRVVTYEGTGSKTVTVYKTITQNGQQVSREAFVNSTYRSMADEVTVGTKVREQVAVEEKEEEVSETVVETTPSTTTTTPSTTTTTTPSTDSSSSSSSNSSSNNSSDNSYSSPSDSVVTEPESTPSTPEPEPTPPIIEAEPTPSTPEPAPVPSEPVVDSTGDMSIPPITTGIQ